MGNHVYEPTDADWTALSITQYREPIEEFIATVLSTYSKNPNNKQLVDEMSYVMREALDSLTLSRFGFKTAEEV